MIHPFDRGAIAVTSISGPNTVLKALADGALKKGGKLIVTGDSKSPKDFKLEGCDFYGLDRQRSLPFAYAKLCPERSYTRKNIAYLIGISEGAEFIVETDDDNFPLDEFWSDRTLDVKGDFVAREGWLNAYRYFSETNIYPRGFPLEQAMNPAVIAPALTASESRRCPIQQGLSDQNPDVDAIYRMLFPLPIDFEQREPLILGATTWCPFNSQNTTTFREAYLLLYLPAFCSFRMTDIWRSFVAQRIAWTCGWHISFHSSTVYQERNEHDLLGDFADEVPGYLNNHRIARAFDALNLEEGPPAMAANMRLCYQELIKMGLVEKKELDLLEAWFTDLQKFTEA